MLHPTYLTADEVVQQLGISHTTLYAYVSRGLIRAQNDGNTRRKRYSAEDVDTLLQRKAWRKSPEKVTEKALYWGSPLLETELSCITQGHLYYRGQDAIQLAATQSVEATAAWLWTCELTATWPFESLFDSGQITHVFNAFGKHLTLIEQCEGLLPLVASQDLRAYDLRPDAVYRTGMRILNLLTGIISGERMTKSGVIEHLSQVWELSSAGADLLRKSLILCADHELNVSTFTARCVASAGANPYGVIQAGLAALKGPRHGGHCERVEALFNECQQARTITAVMKERLSRGDAIPGFGHRLYPEGDPRAAALLGWLAETPVNREEMQFCQALQEEGQRITGEAPTIDFARVMLSRLYQLPSGSTLALFALGRTLGWIAHANEQYQTGQMIRPRASYIGPPIIESFG